MQEIVTGLQNALRTVVEFLPALAGFLLILIIGLIIAKILTTVLAKLLKRVGFNRLVERSGLKVDASTVVSKIIFYTLVLFVLTAAFGVFGPNPVSAFLAAIIAYLPLVFVAILIMVIAAAIAAGAKGLIQNSLGQLSYGRVLANTVSGVILAFGVIAALNQLNIAENVVNAVLYAVLAALVGIAIVAIGGGGITPMKSRWDAALARYDEEKPKIAEQVAQAPSVKDQAQQAKGTAQDKTDHRGQQSAPRGDAPTVPAEGRTGAYRP